MKKAFQSWYIYVIAVGIALLGVMGTMLPYFIIADTAKYSLNQVAMLLIFVGIVIFGVGFIIQDVYRATQRHKTKNWNNPLDEKALNVAWTIFAPALLGGGLVILTGAVLSIFFH